MIPIDLQSSRSVPPSKRFAAIPIGGYRPAVARRGPRGVTKAGRDRIARPHPEIRQKQGAGPGRLAREPATTARRVVADQFEGSASESVAPGNRAVLVTPVASQPFVVGLRGG
jgi:hypothetical protein